MYNRIWKAIRPLPGEIVRMEETNSVDSFVQAGQTIPSLRFQTFCGGKGLNQSIAAARAGAHVLHAGAVGPDGQTLEDCLRESGVDVSALRHLDTATGHAVIQVDPSGQNCIIVTGGANVELTREYIDTVLDKGCPGDIVLPQNEVNNLPYIMEHAHRKGFRLAVNPSPITPELLRAPLEYADYLILNEIEGAQIADFTGNYPEILEKRSEKFPNTAIVLTLGSQGVLYRDARQTAREHCFPVAAVDTTAAGDTFCGYFLAGCLEGLSVQDCLTLASQAAAITVTKAGASASIPTRDEVRAYRF